MGTRRACARAFYSGASPRVIDKFLTSFEPPALAAVPVAGVVPHAGWVYSGRTAARVFRTLACRATPPATFVFMGAVHRAAQDRPFVDPAGAWETPFGDISVNEELAAELLAAGIGLAADPAAHANEHAIEVSLPFVRHFFPRADFVPIACPPFEDVPRFGTQVGRLLRDRDAVVIASTDLTHYGEGYGFAPAGSRTQDALAYVAENDDRMLRLVRALDAEAIVPEARSHLNACGSGALAATVAAAAAMGAHGGTIVEYRTSHDAAPSEPAVRVVGYAGAVLV
jgi:AmmeMemoRadiSam system protein B